MSVDWPLRASLVLCQQGIPLWTLVMPWQLVSLVNSPFKCPRDCMSIWWRKIYDYITLLLWCEDPQSDGTSMWQAKALDINIYVSLQSPSADSLSPCRRKFHNWMWVCRLYRYQIVSEGQLNRYMQIPVWLLSTLQVIEQIPDCYKNKILQRSRLTKQACENLKG